MGFDLGHGNVSCWVMAQKELLSNSIHQLQGGVSRNPQSPDLRQGGAQKQGYFSSESVV